MVPSSLRTWASPSTPPRWPGSRAELLERCDVDPDEDARRRQLRAERRERVEQRDRAAAALGIRWQSVGVEIFGDEPEPVLPSGHGAIVAALREFEALRPPWQHEAACRHVEDVSFFRERGESAEPAKAVCAGCPVADAAGTTPSSTASSAISKAGRTSA